MPTAKTAAGVARQAASQFKAGNNNNPGGLTKAEREARDAVRQALAEPDMRREGLAAYRRLLEADNPVIVKDFMDRLAGKVQDRLEVNDVTPNKDTTPPLTNDERRAYLKHLLTSELQAVPPVK